MVLPGFGWPTFYVQGCDSARHTQRLILTHLPSCFQLLRPQGLPQSDRTGVPCQGPSHSPGQTAWHPRHLSLWSQWDEAGRGLWTGLWGDLSPWTQFILKPVCIYVCSWFSSEVTWIWGSYRFLIQFWLEETAGFPLLFFSPILQSSLCICESLHRYFIYRLFQVVCCGISSWQNVL